MAYNSCKSITMSSIDAHCDSSIGGIKRILIAQRSDVTGVTLDSTTGIITAITMAQTKKFQQWLFRRNTGSYTSTATGDPTTGNNGVTTEVSLQFSKAEAQKRLEIQSAINADCVLIIEDMYGQFIYLGYDQEVTITNAVMQSGTAKTDLNGFTLTFTDESIELPYFVDGEIIDALVAE
jgi:hypothetical protein